MVVAFCFYYDTPAAEYATKKKQFLTSSKYEIR